MSKKRTVISYNLCQLPHRMTAKDVMEKIKRDKICLYDSTHAEGKPSLIHLDKNNKEFEDVIFVDISKEKE